ncbi:hypothetical protein [Stenotrophomonas mori]|uniref:DUF748 domain-containing protein n=1 Tax=Stenotrophomonas mori TaxID=2871096 RepID=A0ABT0SEU7_9GAMM|nr:hypothetical protein [Stenotrophomonas mori]MCL7713837.1 hypothetical protein [Stenotrophomonas mori]
MHDVRTRLPSRPRRGRSVLFVLAVVYGLYLLAGNVFLNTPLFARATNRMPHKFVMTTGPAITLLPGHVTAWNVRLRGHANHTVYVLRAERASARMALLPLLRRELRVPQVRATGVVADIERVAQAVPPPPRGDRGWTLRFDAIRSHSLRQVRFGDLQLSGRGRAEVGFLKQLRGGPSELFESRMGFSAAAVTYQGREVLHDMALTARAHYPRHYREQAPGLAKLGLLHAELEVAARSGGLRLAGDGAPPGIGDARIPGQLQVSAVLDRGAVQPGSRVAWRLPLQLDADDDGPAWLALRLDAGQDGLTVQARLPPRDDRKARLEADLQVAGRTLPFQDPGALLPRLSGTVRGEWQLASLDWIPALFVRRPWLQLNSGGLLQADLRLHEGALAPGSTVDIPAAEAVAEVAGVRMAGTASAHGRIEEGTPAHVRLAVQLPRFEARASGAQRALLFDGRDLSLLLTGDGRLQELRKGVRAQLRFADAAIPDLAAYDGYLGGTAVRLLGGRGVLSGDVVLNTDGRVGHGRMQLRGHGARVRVAGLDLAGTARVDATLRRGDFSQRHFDLSGTTLELRDVQVDGQRRKAPWQGRLSLDRGRIDAQSPFRVDARATLGLSDAGPLLAVFAAQGDYPRWALSLLDSGRVEATTALRWQPGHLLLEGLEAENARLSLKARLELLKQHKRGDLYLRWGVLGAAVELDGTQRHWHLLKAREWFQSRPPLLDGVAPPPAADGARQ